MSTKTESAAANLSRVDAAKAALRQQWQTTITAVRPLPNHKYLVKGDGMALAALTSDNLGICLLACTILGSMGVENDLLYGTMLPAIGLAVLFGNGAYWLQARRMAAESGRESVCCQPFGINAPNVFIFSFSIIANELRDGRSPEEAYNMAVACSFLTGCVQLICVPLAPLVAKYTPQVAMLGCIAGVALVYLCLGPIVDYLAEEPIVTFPPFVIILIGAYGGVQTNLPIITYAIVLGVAIAWGQGGVGEEIDGHPAYANKEALTSIEGIGPKQISPVHFWDEMSEAVSKYLGVILPAGLSVIVGDITCCELCGLGGDSYSVRETAFYDAIFTLAAALMGSMLQVTTYPNHPGYSRLGGRTGYSLIHAVIFALVCFFGLVPLFLVLIPVHAISPTVVFVGLMIITEGIIACKNRPHLFAALVLAILPAVANYCQSQGVHTPPIDALANGYIITGLCWAAMFITLIECDFVKCAMWVSVLCFLSFFGIIHSTTKAWENPVDGEDFPDIHNTDQVWRWTAGYGTLLPTLLVFWLMQRYQGWCEKHLGIRFAKPRKPAEPPCASRTSVWVDMYASQDQRKDSTAHIVGLSRCSMANSEWRETTAADVLSSPPAHLS